MTWQTAECYARERRQRTTAPIRPVLSNKRLAGSGTAEPTSPWSCVTWLAPKLKPPTNWSPEPPMLVRAPPIANSFPRAAFTARRGRQH
jgi:hypothetical protein